MHGTAPTSKNYPAPYVSGGKGERPSVRALHALTNGILATILQANYYYSFLHFADEEMSFGDVKRTIQGHSRTWCQDAKPGVWDVEGPTCSHVTNHLPVDVPPKRVCVSTHVVTALSTF